MHDTVLYIYEMLILLSYRALEDKPGTSCYISKSLQSHLNHIPFILRSFSRRKIYRITISFQKDSFAVLQMCELKKNFLSYVYHMLFIYMLEEGTDLTSRLSRKHHGQRKSGSSTYLFMKKLPHFSKWQKKNMYNIKTHRA